MKVFVYGTLKHGGRYHGRVAQDVVAIDKATIHGTLYDLEAGYPALILDGNDLVHGEVLTFASDKMLPVLDEIEGCVPGQPSLYHRLQQSVKTAQGEVNCWVYVWGDLVPLKGVLVKGGYWPVD